MDSLIQVADYVETGWDIRAVISPAEGVLCSPKPCRQFEKDYSPRLDSNTGSASTSTSSFWNASAAWSKALHALMDTKQPLRSALSVRHRNPSPPIAASPTWAAGGLVKVEDSSKHVMSVTLADGSSPSPGNSCALSSTRCSRRFIATRGCGTDETHSPSTLRAPTRLSAATTSSTSSTTTITPRENTRYNPAPQASAGSNPPVSVTLSPITTAFCTALPLSGVLHSVGRDGGPSRPCSPAAVGPTTSIVVLHRAISAPLDKAGILIGRCKEKLE